MKNWQISGFLTLLLLGSVLLMGCTGTGSPGSASTPTATPAEAAPTTAIPTSATVAQTSTAPVTTHTAAPSTLPVSYTTNDTNKHFVDIAFGPDYSYIYKWNKQLVVVAVTGTYTDGDVKTLNDFFRVFNSYSSSTKLPAEVKQSDNGVIVLNFLPESSLKNINPDNGWKISRNHETGSINCIYKTMVSVAGGDVGNIYINSDLQGNARTHWILRSLLYELGFPGETGTYPDSIFYPESDTTTSLSKIDLKALELMYGSKISSGMTLSQIKDLLLLNHPRISIDYL